MRASVAECPECGEQIVFINTGQELQTACGTSECCVMTVHIVIQKLHEMGHLAQQYPDRWTVVE